MIIKIENAETSEKLTTLSSKKFRSEIGRLAESYLRQEFESANTSPTVQALIEIADFLECCDLSQEFTSSINH